MIGYLIFMTTIMVGQLTILGILIAKDKIADYINSKKPRKEHPLASCKITLSLNEACDC